MAEEKLNRPMYVDEELSLDILASALLQIKDEKEEAKREDANGLKRLVISVRQKSGKVLRGVKTLAGATSLSAPVIGGPSLDLGALLGKKSSLAFLEESLDELSREDFSPPPENLGGDLDGEIIFFRMGMLEGSASKWVLGIVNSGERLPLLPYCKNGMPGVLFDEKSEKRPIDVIFSDHEQLSEIFFGRWGDAVFDEAYLLAVVKQVSFTRGEPRFGLLVAALWIGPGQPCQHIGTGSDLAGQILEHTSRRKILKARKLLEQRG